MSTMNQQVIGIDTGGTYTDAVLLDYDSRKVLAFSKSLTTRDNLNHGISKALEALEIGDAASVRLVGISSTLATNSIAEGKARRAGLILIGYDPDLIAAYGLAAKLPTACLAHFKGGHTTQGLENEPLDLAGIREWVGRNQAKVDALAVSAYFSPLNPSHENRALAAIRQICSLPVVLGHHLSTRLDSIKRATTACLNASLVAVMQEFIEAVRSSLHNHGIRAPLMIVKGDGSLIPYEEAVHKPVETVLSGPAASAIGGRFLSGRGNALVIDVGGTTTDLALIEDSKMTISEDGALLGTFETAVRAARIRTAAIGGDSRIHFEGGERLRLGPERVVPLARLAAEFPRVEAEIGALKKKRERERRSSDLEYWFSYHENAGQRLPALTTRQQELLDLLQEGPRCLSHILKKLAVHHRLQLNADDLIQRGTIEQAALTPTDLLHHTGRVQIWSVAAARQAVQYACEIFSHDPQTVAREAFDFMIAKMVEEAIVFLGRQAAGNLLAGRIEGPWAQWLVNEAVAGNNPYLEVTIASRFPIIGIGAPAEIFVEGVARRLQAPFVLPEHAPVANAVGAVAGSVIVAREAIVYPRDDTGKEAWTVRIDDENADFEAYEAAVDYADQAVAALALEAAVAAGAVDPQVIVEQNPEGHLQRIVACAIGNPRL